MDFLYILDLIGTFAFAVSGALSGVKKDMDIYGIAVLSIVTSVGGGTLRDVLVGRVPPFIFVDYNYVIISIIAASIVFFFHKIVEKSQNILLIMDALGLGVFTVIGVSVGIKYNVGYIGSIFLGVMTGTFGGMIRDVLQGEVPLVLKREIYASACIVGGILFLFLQKIGLENSLNVFISALFVFFVRVMAIYRNWNLPKPKSRGAI